MRSMLPRSPRGTSLCSCRRPSDVGWRLKYHGVSGLGLQGVDGIPASAITDAQAGRFDMHMHVGDIAYDMPVNHGATGDVSL